MNKTILLLVSLLCWEVTPAQQTLENGNVDVFLIGGQSNATGQGRVSNLPRSFVIDKEVMLYYSKYTNKGVNSMEWISLCPASESSERFGMELSLGGALHRLHPERKIALIKHGLSGSNLYAQWNPGNVQGSVQGVEYKKFLATVRAGLDALREQGYQPVIRAVFWQQGEADARDLAGEVNNRSYASNLSNFIGQVRKDLECNEMYFIYGTVMPMAAERFPGRDAVKEAQRQVAEAADSPWSVKNAILVEADDLQMLRSDYNSPNSKDDVHLGTFGVLVLGERFARTYQNTQR